MLMLCEDLQYVYHINLSVTSGFRYPPLGGRGGARRNRDEPPTETGKTVSGERFVVMYYLY